jgi:SNF2 family DNA or RNA helicase
MISAELYAVGRPLVIIERQPHGDSGAWARLQEAYSRGMVGGSPIRLEVRIDVFFSELASLREVRTIYGTTIDFGITLKSQLKALASDRASREAAVAVAESGFDPAELDKQLKQAGFIRDLKPFQLENLAAIRSLPHGADFSVPGAGKTTVALANFALARMAGQVERMLVVGPLAAFAAWKEDAVKCITPAPIVAVHGSSETLIPQNATILLTSYNRVASDYDRIRAFVAERPTQMILDEAHRVKRGAFGVHGRAVLDLAYAAKRRDVLTGTPAPQGAFDLIALVRFLYPGQDHQILPASTYVEKDGRDEDVLRETGEAIKRYFVRTPKAKLNLPPTVFNVIRRPMGAIQQAIYDGLIGKFRTSLAVTKATRREFDRLGRIVMYLLEGATNPMLLAAGSDTFDAAGFAHPPLDLRGDESLMDLLGSYRNYETPWKYESIMAIVSEAASKGEKVLIWSSFVRNLTALQRFLSKYRPALVHGGVPPEDGASSSATVTREAELKRFREDSACSVLLANPAAMGEGVSLHHWCHHAVYLDRTFNAGHFLQSQDRIHRLGLADGTLTKFTILISTQTIDESVDGRLRDKVTALSRLLDDEGLVSVSLPESDEDTGDPPAFPDDLAAVFNHIEARADVT